MKKQLSLFVVSFLTIATCIAQSSVQNLLTENKNNPIGIDISVPRFSWQLKMREEIFLK